MCSDAPTAESGVLRRIYDLSTVLSAVFLKPFLYNKSTNTKTLILLRQSVKISSIGVQFGESTEDFYISAISRRYEL